MISPLFSLKDTIPLFVVIPILVAVLSNFLYKRSRAVKIIAGIGVICLVSLPFLTSFDNNYYVFGAHPQVKSFLQRGVAMTFNLGIAYQYTQLQMVVLLIFSLMAALAVGVAMSMHRKVSGVYLFLVLMAISAACAVILVDDIFNLFVFFEISTVAQAGIVAWMHDDESFKTALKYVLLGSVAGSMLLLGAAFLLGSTGVLNISDMFEYFTSTLKQQDVPIVFMGLALVLFAWTYGGGLPPFHTIKSELYARASPEAGAILQAISKVMLISVGIIIARLFFWRDATWESMLIISTFAMIIGGGMAMIQNDFRRLVAYVAVNQAGVVGIGLSFFRKLSYTSTGIHYAWGHEGMAFGIFHGFNEIIVTSALFISAAVVFEAYGHTRMPGIKGLLIKNKEFALLTLISMLAVSGLPPLNCFQSEWRLIQFAFGHGFAAVGLLMVVSTVMVFYALMKAFILMFLRPPEVGEETPALKMSFAVALFLVVAVGLEVFFGLNPNMVISPIKAGLGVLFGG